MNTDDPVDPDTAPTRPRMRLGVVIAVALLAGAAVVAASWSFLMPPDTTTAAGTSGTATPDAPSEDGTGSGGTDAAADGATPGPAQNATPVDGSEVLPPESEEPRDRIPPREPDRPVLVGPLPTAEAAQGRLVTGFPVDVLQVTMTARSERDVDDVRAHFQSLWSPYGLTLHTDSAGEISVRNASATVALDVAVTGTGTVYTVFATLRTE
ncbi:MAG: hypothetical protein K0Q58_1182 [Microbacterium sp.]|nr:hypothetical protein [Microbacterium sp.]